jgi:hypothetical protein
MRQLIVDLKAEYSGFRPHKIATICFLRFGRKPSDHTVKRVLADGPRPSVTMRRYPSYAQISDPYQRRRAVDTSSADALHHWSVTLADTSVPFTFLYERKMVQLMTSVE